MTNVYVLKLENDKFYVGRTKNVDFRIDNHFNNNGSEWTKKHKPIEIFEIFKNCDNYDEDKITLQFMEKYGIQNVRGGIYCTLKLTNADLKIINKQIYGATDRCYRCGRNSHYAMDCYAKTHLHGYYIKDSYYKKYSKNKYTEMSTDIKTPFIKNNVNRNIDYCGDCIIL